MDETLKHHEELIDKHEYKLEDIQQDLTDVKVRLGIKDKTNGQVVKYQQDLVDAQEKEREERKEQDAILMGRIDKVDERLWFIVTGIILMVLLEIGLFIVQMKLGV
jgi:uncharacterized protein (UPF0335 family)